MAKFFVDRPIVAIVIAIVMTVVGIITYLRLPVAQFPDIVPPEIQVKTTYTGADALTVEQSVATPIEQQISGVDNMNYMQSVNGNDGTLKLTVNFEVGTDVNQDQILTQMRSNQASSQLPQDVNKFGVTVAKSTSSPLIMFALYSPKGTYDNIFLANYANINLNDEFTRVKGIASVSVFGAGQYAMRIWVKPDQLAKLGLTIPEIINAVNAQNAVNPAGTVGGEPVPKGQEFTYAVRAQGRLQTPEEFGDIVVRSNPDGSMVRVKRLHPRNVAATMASSAPSALRRMADGSSSARMEPDLAIPTGKYRKLRAVRQRSDRHFASASRGMRHRRQGIVRRTDRSRQRRAANLARLFPCACFLGAGHLPAPIRRCCVYSVAARVRARVCRQ